MQTPDLHSRRMSQLLLFKTRKQSCTINTFLGLYDYPCWQCGQHKLPAQPLLSFSLLSKTVWKHIIGSWWMKNENFLVTVIRIEMSKAHGQTLIYRQYHESSQRKREEPFNKFTQLRKKLTQPKEWYWNRKTTPETKLSL